MSKRMMIGEENICDSCLSSLLAILRTGEEAKQTGEKRKQNKSRKVKWL